MERLQSESFKKSNQRNRQKVMESGQAKPAPERERDDREGCRNDSEKKEREGR